MPTTALTFTDATFTARTVGDSPEGLERFGGGTNYENAILAADLKTFPSGGISTTNSFNDIFIY